MPGNAVTHLQPCEDNCGQENKGKFRTVTIEMLYSPRAIFPQMSYSLSFHAYYSRPEGNILVSFEQITIGVNP